MQTVRLRLGFGRVCLGARLQLDLTQADVARKAGVSRAFIARIERGKANPSLDVAERLVDALGIRVLFEESIRIVEASHQGDLVHARCSGFVYRRLLRGGWDVAREVPIEDGRWRGWIDLLAFHASSRTLIVIEIKTRIDDVGELERQINWYERAARSAARRLGWQPRRVISWVLALASDEVEASIRANREILRQAFPSRAPSMAALLASPGAAGSAGRGLALIDPASHARTWLMRSGADGRRSRTRYVDYGDAARRLSAAARR